MRIPCEFSLGLSQLYPTAIQSFVRSFVGQWSVYQGGSRSPLQRGWLQCIQNTGLDYWWLTVFWNGVNTTFQNISQAVDRLALAISDSIRLAGPDNATVHGPVVESTICTQFDWEWLIFSATLTFITAIALGMLLLGNVGQRIKSPIWKSSILPIMYAGQAEPEEKDAPSSIKEMEGSADRTIMFLEGDGSRRHLNFSDRRVVHRRPKSGIRVFRPTCEGDTGMYLEVSLTIMLEALYMKWQLCLTTIPFNIGSRNAVGIICQNREAKGSGSCTPSQKKSNRMKFLQNLY